MKVYARGLAQDVKEQVIVYAQGSARDVKEQYFLVHVYTMQEHYFLVNVYARGLARDVKEQSLWSIFTPYVYAGTGLSGQCLCLHRL